MAPFEAWPPVREVRYPGLESPRSLSWRGARCPARRGCWGSPDKESLDAIKRFLDGLRVFLTGVSWGGRESLVYVPAIGHLKEMTPKHFASLGIAGHRAGRHPDLAGLEHADDLVADRSRPSPRCSGWRSAPAGRR